MLVLNIAPVALPHIDLLVMNFKGIFICRPWLFALLPNPPLAMVIFPFILLKDKQLKNFPVLLNHEYIHIKQILELGILPFYILYLLIFYVNWIIYRDRHLAYLNICFEREAYANDTNLDYLSKRGFWAWRNYR